MPYCLAQMPLSKIESNSTAIPAKRTHKNQTAASIIAEIAAGAQTAICCRMDIHKSCTQLVAGCLPSHTPLDARLMQLWISLLICCELDIQLNLCCLGSFALLLPLTWLLMFACVGIPAEFGREPICETAAKEERDINYKRQRNRYWSLEEYMGELTAKTHTCEEKRVVWLCSYWWTETKPINA